MASQETVSESPSKNIHEFLQRHPQVGRGAAGKAELDNLHQGRETFCINCKIFDNAVLHRDYDCDSMKLVLAYVYVNDEQAVEDSVKDAEVLVCDCGVGREEGPDHHLHEFMRVAEPDCKVHREGDSNLECKDCRPLWFGSNCRGVKGCDRGWLWGMGVSWAG
ncbi:uncharacterized protein FPRO_05683 [Fusarium proliferatum ET1]|uniref:Uncharacterized protein n=1 Tax=Fusarium proliferatum (strain ET1) TaxID=1227346 RepID=A0A1L7VHX8_FUSPR|nr:uncharacterized protein FPRO_05683 [Fusarium proliferatum ET1]CZR39125.1 uncharacterized protein FPRO_05683 [Fusarium proliferatum ET1]